MQPGAPTASASLASPTCPTFFAFHHSIETGNSQCPIQWLEGFVIALSKAPDAHTPSGFFSVVSNSSRHRALDPEQLSISTDVIKAVNTPGVSQYLQFPPISGCRTGFFTHEIFSFPGCSADFRLSTAQQSPQLQR